MAMTTIEIRKSIQNLVEQDEEMRRAYMYLDQTMDWPINETFQLMILLDEVKKRMKDDVVHITYKKKDGSTRHAYGTRDNEVIVRHEGAMLPPKEKQPAHALGTFPYYDIERQAWRCFKLEGLMDIDRGYTI